MTSDDGQGTQVGDLVVWITVNKCFAWGKVTNFTSYGRPIAKQIRGGKNFKYFPAHEISSQYFILRKADYLSTDTMTEEHILSKAVRQYLLLETYAHNPENKP